MSDSFQTEYLRVGETFLGCGGSSVNSLEHRASSMTSHGVAHCTEVLEDLLSFTGVTTGLLLLGSHNIIFKLKMIIILSVATPTKIYQYF